MRSWRRRFQQWWMTTDQKPKKGVRRYIEKQNRQDAKRECNKEFIETYKDKDKDE